jgi:hypothetical protein
LNWTEIGIAIQIENQTYLNVTWIESATWNGCMNGDGDQSADRVPATTTQTDLFDGSHDWMACFVDPRLSNRRTGPRCHAFYCGRRIQSEFVIDPSLAASVR